MTLNASLDRLWGGTQVQNGAELSAVIEASGQRLSGRRTTPEREARIAEAAEFLADVLDGRRSTFWLQEALSTSDFPLLMGDILDRQLLGRYNEIPATYRSYCRIGSVRDFRTVRRLQTDGLEGRYYPTYAKPELTAPREDNDLDETGYTYAVSVYQRAVALNWRMLVNDDLNAFRDIPDRLARGARRTEEYFATQLFVDSAGPHASLYTSGNANIINTTNGASATNPPLNVAGFQDAMTVLGKMLDADGEPIAVGAVHLVVPPALEVVAMNLLNATEILAGGNNQTGGGGSAAQQIRVANWMRNRVRLHVNPYIPIIATTNGNTSWFLFADPSESRPALEVGFLRGYESPSLFQKAPNTQRVGGGLEPLLGDFDTNEIRYKGMVIIGGTRMDGKATVASNGSGS